MHPVINQWDDIGKLKLDENNVWLEIFREMLRYAEEICEGDQGYYHAEREQS